MISLEAYSELLEVLYAAPVQPDRWQDFCALLSRYTGSTQSGLLCADSRLGLSIRSQGGSITFDAETYNKQFASTDPFRTPIVRDGRPRVTNDEELLPNEGLLQTEMYRSLMSPQGFRYATLVVPTIQLNRLECITILRTMERGPMDADGLRLLELLFPHIQQALELRQVIGVTQQQAAGAEAMADASGTATFLLTRTGQVVHRNSAAEELVQAGELVLQGGVLTAGSARFKDGLKKLLMEASVSGATRWQTKRAHALGLPQASGGQPLQLLASPLPAAQRSETGADVLLLVSDPEKVVNFPDNVLRDLYGLTVAQTEVANGLLTGYTLEEIACLRKVSVGTVRQQLKAILSKTGTARQSDLIRVLMKLPGGTAS